MIKVYATKIIITDYSLGDNEELEEALSYWDKALFRYVLFNAYYDEEKRYLYIPRGYSYSKLENQLNTGVERREDEYSEYDKIVFTLLKPPRDKKQTTALSFLAGVNGFELYAKKRRKMLQLGTGIGKTYIAIAIMWHFKLKGAIVMNKDGLIEQWRDKILEYTNITKEEIYIIRGGDSIDKLYDMNENDKKKFNSIKVFIVSHATITAFANKSSWNKVTELYEMMRVGINIYDEAHLAYKNILMMDFHTNTYLTMYLTATAGKSDMNQNRLYIKAFSNLPTLTIKTEQAESKVTSFVIRYETEPTLMEQGLMKTRMGINRNYYMEYTMTKGRELFFRALKLVINTFKDQDISIAILLLRIFAVYDVKEFLEKEFPELKGNIGTYISDIPKNERKKELDKKIILTTAGSFGTGMDLEKLFVIVNAEPGSSKIVLEQNFGRLRNKGYYFEIFDKGIIKRNNQFNIIKPKLTNLSKKVIIKELV